MARGFDLGEDVAFQLLRDHFNHRCKPPWKERDLRHKCHDADKKSFGKPRGWLLDEDRQHGTNNKSDGLSLERLQGVVDRHGDVPPHGAADKPADIHLTDVGNAQRLVADHGEDLRHCHPWKKWLAWDGKRWRLDDTGEAVRRAKATVKALYAWAAEQIASLTEQTEAEEDEAAKKRLRKINQVLAWALKSEDAKRIAAMLDMARSERFTLPRFLDRDPWLLNVGNGTLDLRTARLHPHRREDMLTKLCPTAFDEDANCPHFLTALETIFDGDRALINYVQRFCGYSITGDVREHHFAVAFGSGSNGKSLLFNVLLDVIGSDYSGMVAPELLLETAGSQHPTIQADLFGKRLMVAAESGEGRRLNEARIKALTGGDTIKARRMKEDFWEFAPTHKLVLFTNHRPQVKGNDHGIWRRLALWPFNVRFWDADKGEKGLPQHQADKDLANKLKAEAPGILSWLLAGCRRWLETGLEIPDCVTRATADYRNQEDAIGNFLAERCSTGHGLQCRAGDLYSAYKNWCESSGEHHMTQTAFGRVMTEREFGRHESHGIWYTGLGLQHQTEESEYAS
jgi:putative DNA primase/helicase